ncbi:uncharacterized protein M8220_004538 isoform 2-T2 [Acridotheres tristis]
MERRLSLEQRTERLVRRRPSGRPPSLDAAMPPPGHKGTPSGHRDPPGMPTWATPTHGGANKAVTPQNCTREVGRPPKSPLLPPPTLGLPPIPSPPHMSPIGGFWGLERGCCWGAGCL